MNWEVTLVVGVLFALAFVHRTGWNPGGLVTPGYLVLYLSDGSAAAWIAALALTTWLTALLARRWLPLHGRRRWTFCVATAAALRALVELLSPVAGFVDPLGLVVPGLIASALTEQGPGPTFTALITVTAATWWALIALGLT